jgi:hypothetical protein
MRSFLKSLKERHHKSSERRRCGLACEALENRLVLTYAASTSLLGSLSYVGVVTSPQVSLSIPVLPIVPILPPGPILPILPHGSNPLATSAPVSAWTQLGTDLQALRTELQSLAGKSGVTIADLESLTVDSQTIAQAGFHFPVKGLNSAISDLATAVAGEMPTSQAQTAFTGLFSGSSVTSATIMTTFTDLTQAIHDSAVTTTDLSTVAADEAAIQTDLSKLPIWWYPGGEPWLDGVGIAPAAISVAPTVVTTIPNPAPAISVPPANILSTLSAGPLAITVSPPISLPAIISPTSLAVPAAIIVSPFGGAGLLGALSSVGVVTSPVIVSPPITVLPPVTAIASGPFSKLQADVRTLETELQSLAAKSALTIADLQNLENDGQAINQAGFFFNFQSLDKVVSELATAVAGGSSTAQAQAQTDFSDLFSKSSVSTSTINTAFNDLVKAVQDSKVLPTDLTTVAADQAAIQADLKNLFPVKGGGSGSGSGTTGGSASGSGTSGTTGSGSTGSVTGKKAVVGHKNHHPVPVVAKPVSLVHARKLSRSKKR